MANGNLELLTFHLFLLEYFFLYCFFYPSEVLWLPVVMLEDLTYLFLRATALILRSGPFSWSNTTFLVNHHFKICTLRLHLSLL
jgi:hypothetical protein